MFEKVATVFQEESRYEALSTIHTNLLETIEENLPPERDRPTAVLAGFSDVESPYVYTVDTPGFLTAHVRPLAPTDAFGDEVSSGDAVDMEMLLEADPDVILTLGGMHPETDMPGIRAGLRTHAVGQQLSAVEAGRIHAQGARYQGRS